MTSDTELPVRPAYRPFEAEVTAVAMLSPNFVRVQLTGPDFADFGTGGLDQRVKVIFPLADGSFSDFGATDPQTIQSGNWYARWRNLPDPVRNPLRTYTVRKIDPATATLSLDFVLHEPAGPACAWAKSAKAGDRLIVVGPDEKSPDRLIGIDWHPGIATDLLLAGDETAVPAIMSILESLPADRRVWAFIEVPCLEDRVEKQWPDSFKVVWTTRDSGAASPRGAETSQSERALFALIRTWIDQHGDIVTAARSPKPQEVPEVDVDSDILWDSPAAVADGQFYAWLAGESALIKALRRLLVTEHGVDRKRVAFMGYWREGQAEQIK